MSSSGQLWASNENVAATERKGLVNHVCHTFFAGHAGRQIWGGFCFLFDPREGQDHVKVVQTSKFNAFSPNLAVLFRFVARFQTCCVEF